MPTPSQQANYLREELGLPEDRVIGDLVEVITKSCGYEYTEQSFGNSFSAFTQSLGNGKFLVCFNSDHDWSSAFKRFTLAHELGHLHIPEHREILKKETLHRSSAEYSSDLKIEREADLFAINFLAPEKPFAQVARSKEFSPREIDEIASHFGISRYACAKRFLELTGLVCTMMVCDEKGNVEYESRSTAMKETYKHSYISHAKIPKSSVLYDWLKGDKSAMSGEISLVDWLPNLRSEVRAFESIIELGYNKKYLVLITPDIADVDTDDDERRY